jgi:hypothetical protein
MKRYIWLTRLGGVCVRMFPETTKRFLYSLIIRYEHTNIYEHPSCS